MNTNRFSIGRSFLGALGLALSVGCSATANPPPGAADARPIPRTAAVSAAAPTPTQLDVSEAYAAPHNVTVPRVDWDEVLPPLGHLGTIEQPGQAPSDGSTAGSLPDGTSLNLGGSAQAEYTNGSCTLECYAEFFGCIEYEVWCTFYFDGDHDTYGAAAGPSQSGWATANGFFASFSDWLGTSNYTGWWRSMHDSPDWTDRQGDCDDTLSLIHI